MTILGGEGKLSLKFWECLTKYYTKASGNLFSFKKLINNNIIKQKLLLYFFQ